MAGDSKDPAGVPGTSTPAAAGPATTPGTGHGLGYLGVWAVAVFLLVAMLEYAPKVGGALLLVLVAYLATRLA